jgi:hypothetical protein
MALRSVEMLFLCKQKQSTDQSEKKIEFWINYFQLKNKPNTSYQITDNCTVPPCWNALICIPKDGVCVMSDIIKASKNDNDIFNQWAEFLTISDFGSKIDINTLFSRFNSAYQQACTDNVLLDLKLLAITGKHIVVTRKHV